MTTSFLDSTAKARACMVVLGGESFAFDVAHTKEVVLFDDSTVIPPAPAHVIGVANLRGDVMPIVDARPVLGLPARRTAGRHRTLVVAANGLEAALMIDGVASLEAFGEVVPVEDAGEQRHGRWATGFLRRDDRLVPLLDTAKLLEALRPGTPRAGAA
jgi:purine-binding chemotaxis protein CheW